jgi:hypothetical protein
MQGAQHPLVNFHCWDASALNSRPTGDCPIKASNNYLYLTPTGEHPHRDFVCTRPAKEF